MTSDPDYVRRRLEALGARYRRPTSDHYHPVPAELDRAIAEDTALASVAREARSIMYRDVARRLRALVDSAVLARLADAFVSVPRERFVLPEDIAHAADDVPLSLDDQGLSTISAPHAYLLSYGLIQLRAGDDLVELGTGTGYGAALGHAIVARSSGPKGRVTSVEIDPVLHQRACRLIGEAEGISLIHGNAREVTPAILTARAREDHPLKVVVTFAIDEEPEFLLEVLPDGAVAVAPVGTAEEGQQLVRYWREGMTLHRTRHGSVRYVAERD